LLGSRLPRVCSHPPYEQTYGPEAVELAATAGLIADPWQADVLDVVLAVKPSGQWICPECGIVVSRQSGKGAIYEIRAIAGLYLLGERLIMWSAHEYKTAMEGFRRVQDLITNTDDLRKRVFKVSNTNGDEGIELHGEGTNRITGRQRLRFIARSKGSGRGFSGDCNLLDEVFALTAEQVAALMPTVSARPNPQIVYASSPPLDAATGEPLFALKDRGESGNDPALAWFDWGAPAGVDLDDRAEWARSNPAMGIRISEETIARERRSMDAEGFGRERLGIWPVRSKDVIISAAEWAALVDVESQAKDPVAFAVDIAPDRSYSTIAAYGVRPDGVGHAEVIDRLPGVDWVIARLVDLKTRHQPVAIALDAIGPASSLLIDLQKAGIVPPDDYDAPKLGDLAVPSSREVAGACGALVDSVRQQQIRHLDQPALSHAVAGVKTRPLGDAWAWGRRASNVDISPLVALTLARWAFEARAHLITDDDYDLLASVL
jgi:phage terminase large subunit-like protein